MRILYFSRSYTPHDYRFLEGIASAGHSVFFLTLEETDAPHETRPLPRAVRKVTWPNAGGSANTPEEWLRRVPDLDRVLEDVQPDVLHAGPVQSCGWIAALSGFHPLLVMSWGFDVLVDADRDDFWRWMTSYALRHSDALLCDCQAVRQRVQELAPSPGRHVVQFPWGIDLSRFTPGLTGGGIKQGLGWEENFVVLSLRSWEPLYDVLTALEAFRGAYRHDPRMRMILPGDGSLADTISRFITANGLDEVVHRPGRLAQGDLPDYYRAADVYVSCALSDGSSISLLEAMATGLPVVVTDAAGNREWIAPGENGWLADGGDAGAFACALLSAAELSVADRRRMGKLNRHVAEERADWSKSVKSLWKTYDVLREEAGPKPDVGLKGSA